MLAEDDDKIPPYSTFKAAFETLLDEQDFSRKRRGFMEDLSKEDKWSMIAQYKWDTLDMLVYLHSCFRCGLN